jgi:CMP-N,N'-diacetyllegionaminic acid synthase
MKKVFAVIPARGGSKGIPQKNIRYVAGKPLIGYTIEGAQGSTLITHCVVSTDCLDIARVAKECGGEVPFMRPNELATDMAASLPVVQHAVNQAEKLYSCRYDAVLLLQPTCPMRSSTDIDACINQLFSSGADSVVSVVDVRANHPLRMKRLVGDKLINYVDQGYEDMRPRQALPPVYIRNGAIYISLRDIVMEKNTLVGSDCRAYSMSTERSVNIDGFEDLLVAEYYLQNNNKINQF